MEPVRASQPNQATPPDLSITAAPQRGRGNPFQAMKSTYIGPSFGFEKGIRHAIARPQEVAEAFENELSALEGEFVLAYQQIEKIAQAGAVDPKIALAVFRQTIGSDSFVFSLYLIQATLPFREKGSPVAAKLVPRFEEALRVVSKRHGVALCRMLERIDEDEIAEKLTPILKELAEYRERGIDFESVRLDTILDNCRALSEVMTSRNSPLRGIVERWLEERKELKALLEQATVALK